MNKKQTIFYKTTDLSLIAVLQIFGYSIQKMNKDESGKATFFIKEDKGLQKLIQAFWSRSLRVEPLAYFESLKIVKSRIYQ